MDRLPKDGGATTKRAMRGSRPACGPRIHVLYPSKGIGWAS